MVSIQQAINDLKKLPKGTMINTMKVNIDARTEEEFDAIGDAMGTIKHEGVSVHVSGPISY